MIWGFINLAFVAQQSERQSLRLQVERTEKELQLSHEQNSQLTGRLHRAEREVTSLSSQVRKPDVKCSTLCKRNREAACGSGTVHVFFSPQIDSLKHSHKLEVTSIKLECTRSKGELERDRDMLQDQVEGRNMAPSRRFSLVLCSWIGSITLIMWLFHLVCYSPADRCGIVKGDCAATQGSPGGKRAGNGPEGAVGPRGRVPKNRCAARGKVRITSLWLLNWVASLSESMATEGVNGSASWAPLPLTCFSRLELENKLATVEQQRALQDSTDQAQREEWEERMHRVQQEEESTRRELQSLRSTSALRFLCIFMCVQDMYF